MALLAVLALVALGLALLLALVSGLAAVRTKSGRFGFAALAFLAVAARVLLYVLGREGIVDAALVPGSATSLALDVAALVLLYLAVVRA